MVHKALEPASPHKNRFCNILVLLFRLWTDYIDYRLKLRKKPKSQKEKDMLYISTCSVFSRCRFEVKSDLVQALSLEQTYDGWK